jgi:DnaJ family protein B protein 4
MPNFYEVLEIDKTATDVEIKKAYRSLSLKWHPDRNPTPEAHSKFQEINEAYETLSDSGKRAQYDNELNGVRNNVFEMHMGGGMGGLDINNIFNMMFNGGMPPGGMPEGVHVFHNGPGGIHVSMGGGPGPNIFQQFQKPPSIIQNIQLPIEMAYSGCAVQANIERWVIRNNTKVTEMNTVHIQIQPGIDNGEIIILRECGNIVNDNLKGDVKLVVAIENNTPFTRSGLNLHYKKTISLKEALTGFSFEVKHINGSNISVNNFTNRTIITPGYAKTIADLGMMRENQKGNLVIEFTVEFPENLTDEQVAKINEIL